MLTLRTSANGRKFIETWEESNKPLLTARWDPIGKCWEIGYGHTTSAGLPRVYEGMTINDTEADNILSSDLASVEADIQHHVKATINQNEMDAIVSFDFNTGGLDRSSLLRDLNAGHMDRIKYDFSMWVMGDGKVVEGLVKRRSAEYVLFETGKIVQP